MTKKPTLTAKMERVSDLVNALGPEEQRACADVINGLRAAVTGLGKMPKEVGSALMDVISELFRKLLVGKALGKSDDDGERLVKQAGDGITGKLAELIKS